MPYDAPFRRAIEEARTTGAPTRLTSLNGERGIWYEVRTYPYAGGLVIFFRDVTAQKRTEDALVRSEARFRTTADSAPVLIWMSDADGRRVFFNHAWTAFTGRDPEGEKGDGWRGGVHPDDLPRLLALYDGAAHTGEAFEIEYRLRRHDGDYRWMLLRASLRFAADGTFEGLTGSCTDIHQRWTGERQRDFLARASDLLAASLDYEKTLQQVTDLMVPTLADWCAVQIADGDHIRSVATAHVDPEMVAWGRELETDYPARLDEPGGAAEVIASGTSVLASDITPEMLDAAARDDRHRDILRTLDMTSVIIVPLRTRTATIGAIILIATHGSRHYDESDLRFAEEFATRAGIAADNAALYRQARDAEAALRIANDALEARVEARTAELARTNRDLDIRNRELQDFAFVASHDLQEPLRKIQAFASLIDTDFDLPGGATAYLDRVRDSAARMSRLISDLLAFARVTTKASAFVPVDLHDTLADVLADLEVRIAETGGTVVSSGRLPTVAADPVQMRQLVQNLVGNALKFHREGAAPVVRIDAEQRGGEVRITVSDNGIGFEARYAERIFAPFQRLHTRDAYDGTGMGLAIVRRIVDRHGGTIAVESAPGEGTTFVVTLPQAA